MLAELDAFQFLDLAAHQEIKRHAKRLAEPDGVVSSAVAPQCVIAGQRETPYAAPAATASARGLGSILVEGMPRSCAVAAPYDRDDGHDLGDGRGRRSR